MEGAIPGDCKAARNKEVEGGGCDDDSDDDGDKSKEEERSGGRDDSDGTIPKTRKEKGGSSFGDDEDANADNGKEGEGRIHGGKDKGGGGGDDGQGGIPAVFSFDEMSIQKAVKFDQKEEKVYGPHGNVQVGMVRGVFSNFKQPIFYDFDREVDARLVHDVIAKLQKIGVDIVSIVSDMGTKNVKLWNELGVTKEKPYFSSRNGGTISVFADIPHLLKLLRNHFLDQGYILPSGKKFVKEDLLFLVEKDSAEFQLCHKVKPLHFLCKGSQRQRVMLAAQLFSRSVASALRLLYPEKEEEAQFVELVNDCFDVFNSRLQQGVKQLDWGFGMKMDSQVSVLHRAKKMITELRAIGKKSLLPWQKGWLMDIEALLHVFKNLQEKYSAKFLLTARLNQDCLENFFSQIRYTSGSPDARPGPVDFKQRFRNLVLGSSASIIVHSAPVFFENEENPEILSVSLLKDLHEKNISAQEGASRGGENADENTEVCIAAGVPDDAEETEERGGKKRQHEDDSENESGSENEIDCSEEGLKYVAGFLAFKLKKHHPSLGTHERDSFKTAPCPWIDQLSYGGLTKPTSQFLFQIRQFEIVFQKMHGLRISREEGIVRKLKNSLQEAFPAVSEDIISIYAKTRTHIRIKFLKRKNVVADDVRTKKKVKDYVQ